MTERTSKARDAIGLTLALIGTGLALIGAALYRAEVGLMRRQAIEHGYAEYNSQTGKWQWKGTE